MKQLTPAIIQDGKTGTVLMLGYMNDEALAKTKQTGVVWFWSRSKKRLWQKGETSGNTLSVVAIQADCDNDTLLISVNPAGPTCHTGSESCFSKPTFNLPAGEAGVGLKIMTLGRLFSIIQQRKKDLPRGSYTASLFRTGQARILGKVAEESKEVIQSAQSEGRQRLIEESCDILFHLFVLLVSQNVTLDDIEKELTKRNTTK